jgi:predicted TIM-barrel fold metal-dependent hydrolase
MAIPPCRSAMDESEEPGTVDRRTALVQMSAIAAAGAWPQLAGAAERPGREHEPRASTGGARVRKIATEEAFSIPEVAAAIRDVVRRGGANLDLKLLGLIYDSPTPAAPARQSRAAEVPRAGTGNLDRDASARMVLPRLLDIDAGRLADMDANGVDMHLLSLTMPGVQMFDRDTAVALARLANDRLSEAVRRHPTRFAGLGSFAPQDPRAAAQEMERAIRTLKLNGFIVNSHTQNIYLDDPSNWPILEAAEALDTPLYIHPRAPSDGMAGPFRDYRLEGAIWGYGVETGTHVMRLMLSGVLDRFPRLRVVIGHMGEALPFWLWRLDFMASPGSRANLKNQLKPSEYFQRNIAITTSGVEDPLALRFCIDKIGVDRIMWAIDYPYQPSAPAVAFLESAPLSDEERAQVAHRNAERIFQITP